MKKLCLICIALVLAGCGGSAFTRVESARVLVRNSMEVAAQGDWNRYTPNGSRHREMWTQHGVPLDLLVYFTGVSDGMPLDDLAQRDRKTPRFSAGMTPEDIVGLTETMLAGNGGQFELRSLAPATVSGGPGFRFDFHFTSRQEEVERAGTAVGAVVGSKLYMMMFVAPRGRYFDRGQPAALQLMESLRIVPSR